MVRNVSRKPQHRSNPSQSQLRVLRLRISAGWKILQRKGQKLRRQRAKEKEKTEAKEKTENKAKIESEKGSRPTIRKDVGPKRKNRSTRSSGTSSSPDCVLHHQQVTDMAPPTGKRQEPSSTQHVTSVFATSGERQEIAVTVTVVNSCTLPSSRLVHDLSHRLARDE